MLPDGFDEWNGHAPPLWVVASDGYGSWHGFAARAALKRSAVYGHGVSPNPPPIRPKLDTDLLCGSWPRTSAHGDRADSQPETSGNNGRQPGDARMIDLQRFAGEMSRTWETFEGSGPMSNLKASRMAKTAGSVDQPGLFDEPEHIAPQQKPSRPRPTAHEMPNASAAVIRLTLRAPKLRRLPPPRSAKPQLITIKDLPAYPEAEVAAVERAVAAIPTERALLGYKEVQDYFGVSKATANRRMKDGLVPGVRMIDGVVMRDGGVRRLSREQVKWLLLAVRLSRTM